MGGPSREGTNSRKILENRPAVRRLNSCAQYALRKHRLCTGHQGDQKQTDEVLAPRGLWPSEAPEAILTQKRGIEKTRPHGTVSVLSALLLTQPASSGGLGRKSPRPVQGAGRSSQDWALGEDLVFATLLFRRPRVWVRGCLILGMRALGEGATLERARWRDAHCQNPSHLLTPHGPHSQQTL